jgi:hypothetical protein
MTVMANPSTLCDVTGTVPLDDAAAVADAIDGILSRSFGAGQFDRALLRSSFAFVERLFEGGQAGYLACDMPYHDLRHSLDAALAMARLVDGYRQQGGTTAAALTPDLGLAAVLLALLHDTGFLRTTAEASLCGPELAAAHEPRSAAFAAGYLRSTALAPHAHLASLILATRVATAPGPLLAGRNDAANAIGRMLGSADLLCQMADRRYLERCYHHLYPELLIGGGDRCLAEDGGQKILFRDARDLVAHTPGFYANVARPRLEQDFGNVGRHLVAHFGGADPYARSTRDNLERCATIVGGDRWDLLDGPPMTTTRELDPRYRAEAPFSDRR